MISLLIFVYIPTASERSLLEEQRNTFSAVSDIPAERNGSKKSSSHGSNRSMDTDSTLGGASVHSIHRYIC